jgi:hypothetical protein
MGVQLPKPTWVSRLQQFGQHFTKSSARPRRNTTKRRYKVPRSRTSISVLILTCQLGRGHIIRLALPTSLVPNPSNPTTDFNWIVKVRAVLLLAPLMAKLPVISRQVEVFCLSENIYKEETRSGTFLGLEHAAIPYNPNAAQCFVY